MLIVLVLRVLFVLAMVLLPLALTWPLVWSLKHGKLSAIARMGMTTLSEDADVPEVTRRDKPMAFWTYIAGNCLLIAAVAAFNGRLLFGALKAWLQG